MSAAAEGAPLLAAVLAAAAAACTALRVQRWTSKAGWALMAATAGAWCVAWADINVPLAQAVAAVTATAAVLVLVGDAIRPTTKVRLVVDGLLAATSLTYVAWHPVIDPLLATHRPWQELVVPAAPIAAHIAVLSVLLAAGVRVTRESRATWLFLAGAFSLVALSSGLIAYAVIGHLMQVPLVNQACSATAAMLVLAAARRGAHELTPLDQDLRPARPFAILLPYAPLLIAAVATGAQWVSGPLDTLLLGLGGITVLLSIVRQLLAQLEMRAVSRRLEAVARGSEERLAQHEHRLQSLLQHANEMLTILDTNGVVTYQSGASTRVTGLRPADLLGLRISSIIHPEDAKEFEAAILSAPPSAKAPLVVEARVLRADGTWFTAETTVADLTADAHIRGILLTIRDITDRKELEERLRHDAFHDPLTGLGNRTLFRDRLSHAAARGQRQPRAVAVLTIDLDGFKLVNDTLGHAAGDQLLREVASRLQKLVRPSDTVARLGGDEFAVLLEDARSGVPEMVAGRILAGLKAPVRINGKDIVTLASIGVALAWSDRMSTDGLMRSADLAMYAAKVKGKGRFEVFEEGMQHAATLRVELENDLRRATRNGELVLHYQPIVDLATGRVAGTEALVRWNHPSRGMVPPNEFIPLAEDSDIVVDIGRWVLWEAAGMLREINRLEVSPTRPPYMAVNIAARQLVTPWLVDEVRKVVRQTGIEPGQLVLEITEGALIHEAERIEPVLTDLRQIGVRLAIDDFGTGWSSLSRLRSFPVDKLKIDRAFVSEIKESDDAAPLIAATIAMGHSLDLQLVAEGVETPEQLACLRNLGCEEVQGYLLHRPVDGPTLRSLLLAATNLIPGELLPDGAVAQSQPD